MRARIKRSELFKAGKARQLAQAPVTVTLNGAEALNYIAYRDIARDLLFAVNHAKPLIQARQAAEQALLTLEDASAAGHAMKAVADARDRAKVAESLISRNQARWRECLQAMTEAIAPPNQAG